jgi:4-methylaminobutanoate oxidase (formaldehyde-forming)
MSSDIGPDHTPDEAGLGWAVKMKSNIAFKGRDAVKAQREGGVKKILATFTCDGDVILSGRETIYRNGKRCGWLSSAGYGHSVGKSIGMGYVRSEDMLTKEDVMVGEYELEVATVRIKAEVVLTALHDPKLARVKG